MVFRQISIVDHYNCPLDSPVVPLPLAQLQVVADPLGWQFFWVCADPCVAQKVADSLNYIVVLELVDHVTTDCLISLGQVLAATEGGL